MEAVQYEHAFIKEFGENEAIVTAAGKDYHILLTDEQTETLQGLLLEEELEYVLFDTKEEVIVLDDVLQMTEKDNPALADLDDGLDEDGIVK
ncbi:hypothetical protein [Thalassobacillus sp. C254]|uniref:hypothetical protein n=1 Tax=Thalassobacillus sp. C254 TaxID=1225341 RepID=UPI0006D09781|nr:hypothetical protein [Thalassobacillus sp. C254]